MRREVRGFPQESDAITVPSMKQATIKHHRALTLVTQGQEGTAHSSKWIQAQGRSSSWRWNRWLCEPHTAHPEEGGTATASGQATTGQTLNRADSKCTENKEHWPWSPAKPQLGASVFLLYWFSCLIFHLSLCVLLIYPVHSPWCFPIILFRRAAPNVLTCDPRWPWLDKVVRASLRLQPPANAVGRKCGTADTQDSHVCAPWVFPSALKAGLTVTEPQLCHSPSCVNVGHVTSPIQFPHLKNRDSNTYITEFKN